MAFNSSNARITNGCRIYIAELSVPLPIDATTPLPEGWVHIGHTPESGATIENLMGTATSILAGDHKSTLLTTYASDGVTLGFSYAEIIPENIVLALNGVRDGNKITVNPTRAGKHYRVCLDTVDQNDENDLRFVLPNATPSSSGALPLNPNDLFVLPTTFTGEYDDDAKGHLLIFGDWTL